jgi:ribose transport system permease protein
MTVVEKEAPAAGGVRPARWAALLRGAGEVRNLGLLGVLLTLGIIGTVTQSTFLTNSNILTILTSASVAGVITVGMTFVIIGGGIDLSVGALVALASVWSTTVATQSYGAGVMVLCALLVGTVSGLVNGLLIAYGRLVPFIVTLATMVGARGLAQKLSDKKTQIVTVSSINNLATDKVLGVPVLVYLFAGVVVLGWVLLNLTT